MSNKFFTALIIMFAVAIAILKTVLPPHHVREFVVLTEFFSVMLPILAAGALIKYLFAGCGGAK